MDRCGTEDLGLTARLMYGYILSNSAVLTPAESSFVLIAGLVPQDVNPQLKGHLKGALNNGASVEENSWRIIRHPSKSQPARPGQVRSTSSLDVRQSGEPVFEHDLGRLSRFELDPA